MAKTQTNNLTNSCLRFLNVMGYKAWRNNNGAVYDVKAKSFRKNPNFIYFILFNILNLYSQTFL